MSRLSVLTGLERAAQAVSLLAFAWLLLLHLAMVFTDAPMEMREGAMVATTVALLDGHKPYAVDGLMQTGNVYGIGYNIAALPFAWLLGPGYVAHRLLSALCIFAACFLVWRWLRGSGVAALDALLATALTYAGFVYFTGAVVRPDGLGILLMLAGVECLRRADCAPRGFAACLALSLLGLACKLYFVWPAFAGAAYVFLFRDWRRGLAYGVSAIAATIAALLVMQALLPGYGSYVLVANLRDADYAPLYLLHQLADWSLFTLPLLTGFAATLLLLRPSLRRLDLFGGFALMGAAALLLLGGHTGAHLSYFFQLFTPYFAVVALALATRRAVALSLFRLTLPLAILANAHWFPLTPSRILQAGTDFSRVRQLIADSDAVLATAEFAGPLAESHRPVADTGHGAYLVNATRPAPALLRDLLPPASVIASEWDKEKGAIRGAVAGQSYDLALIGAPSLLFPMELLASRYEARESFMLDMPWALQRWPVIVWRPRQGH